MFFDTVDDLVSDLQAKIVRLRAVGEKRVKDAAYHTDLAAKAQTDAERAHRIADKVTDLIA